jgi:hypothetical protein
MKLTELDPRWVAIHGWDSPNGTQNYVCGATSGPFYREAPGGLSFICPMHRTHRLVVFFENPWDGLPPERSGKYRWHRENETFDTITLRPSINAQVADPSCWHVFITNGEIQ